MKTIATLRITVGAVLLIAAFACKKHDDGEIDKAGESDSNTSTTEMNNGQTDSTTGIPADTISAGKDGVNGSGIGSGQPNSSGTPKN
jgi:hypothetical protein